MDPTFVGRRAELGLLQALMEEVHAGHPRVVLVEGPPGIGKSALIRRFLANAGAVQVLGASGEEVETLLAFGVIDQLVRAAPGSVPESLLGLLSNEGPTRDPISVGGALVEVVGGLQGEAPVAIVVDDAQWADRPSLQALLFALRRLQADRVLALVCARDSAPPQLLEGLDRFIDSGWGARLTVRGLDPDGIRELAMSMGIGELPISAAQRVRDHTGGSPLHTRALLEELPLETLKRSTAVPLPSPRKYSALVLSRLAACSDEAQRLVIAASVLGLICPLSVVAQLAGVDDPLGALEQTIAGRLLEERDVAEGTVGFPHPLVRAAVYHDLSPTRRAALHERAAALTHDEAASLRHRLAAFHGNSAELVADLTGFGRREAARGAWASAADAILSARRLSASGRERDELLLEAAEYLTFGGEVTAAAALSDDVATLGESARREYVLGSIALMSGRHEEAERSLTGAFALCDMGTDRALATQVAVQLANLTLTRARAGDGAAWAARALEVAQGTIPVSNALSCLAIGLTFAGRPAEAMASVATLPDPSDEVTPDRIDGYLGRGFVRYVTDDHDGACRDLAPLCATLRRRGPAYLAVAALATMSMAEYRMGAWDDSILHGQLAASICEDADQAWLRGYAHASACAPLAARAVWDAARLHVEAARRAAAIDPGEFESISFAAMAAAQLARAQGDDEGVLSVLEPVLPLAEWDGVREPGVIDWQVLYTQALVNLRRLENAEAVLSRYEGLAAERERRSAMAAAARVRACLDAARGAGARAEASFVASLAHLEGVHMPFESGLTDLEYGSFLRRAGKRSQAAAHLRSAHGRFSELGARPFLERCDRELAACGLTPIKRRSPERDRLTPQELSIARLVASGKTNRQVAAELVVSVKTVEYHLANVYGKLGLRSRHQLAASMPAS
jgi:DNA-binding CsgD family transcriptional regulator